MENPEASRTIRLRLPPEAAGERFDKALSRQPELNQEQGLSRSRIQSLITAGDVTADGQPVTKASQLVQGGERVEITVPPARPSAVEPQPIPLDIRYEDEHLLVVNKQRGLVVHPAPGHPDGTLVNALLYHCDSLAGIGGVQRPGIVHRLDKDTTGVLVVAKSDAAHRKLVQAFKERTVHRQYLALVAGRPETTRGIIDAPIGRHPTDRTRMAISNHRGRHAVSHFHVEEELDEFTLLRVWLETGRTHQIRVHLAAIDLPIVGDPVYGRLIGRLPLEGPALHAERITFKHPVSGEELSVTAPLPRDLAATLAQLRRHPPAKP